MRLSLVLNIAIDQFTVHEQRSLQVSIAKVVGLSEADSNRVAIVLHSVTLRRLLSSGVGVDVTINMPNASSAKASLTVLSEGTINQVLMDARLPAASSLTQATLASSSSVLQDANQGASSSSASSSLAIGIGAGVGSGSIIIVVLMIGLILRRRNQVSSLL